MTDREAFINKCISAGAQEANDECLGNANIHRPDVQELLKELSNMIVAADNKGFNDGWEKRNEAWQAAIASKDAEIAALEADNERMGECLHKINNRCMAYPIAIFTEPDWNLVQQKLGNTLLTQVSGSNMRHVVNGIQEIIENLNEQR